MHQTGWKRASLACLAGSLSVLSMAPFFFWPILFVSLPVLVWLLDTVRTPSWRHAFWDGWWFGFGYLFFGLVWIGEAFLVEAELFAWLLPFAVTLLPAGLAIFYGLATALARRFWRRGLSRLLVLATAITGFEWLRGNLFTGLPWNTLGYALTQPLELMQTASVFGIYGLTLWTVVIAASPFVLAVDALEQRRSGIGVWAGLVIASVALMAGFVFGWLQTNKRPVDMMADVKVRLVQPNIAQSDKWRPDKRREIFDTLLALSKTAPDGRDDGLAEISHVIWPEAAIPFLILRTPQALVEIGELLPKKTTLLTGALRFVEQQRPGANGRKGGSAKGAQPDAFNSLMAFDSEGRLVALTDKTHLVPFGEYLPFPDFLNAIGLRKLTQLRGAFVAGVLPRQLLPVPGLGAVAPLICYEALFPNEIVQDGKRPAALLNVTNDAWFGDTTGPRQHFHQVRIRAVEQGVAFIRVANGGISAVVGPQGRILARLDLNRRGTVDSTIPMALPKTVYVIFGDWIAVVLAAIFLAGGFMLGRRDNV
ncbi:MAG: apolipoprotein N-acyltransferase [Hyphomicrobiaceae bacterium]